MCGILKRINFEFNVMIVKNMGYVLMSGATTILMLICLDTEQTFPYNSYLSYDLRLCDKWRSSTLQGVPVYQV